MATQLEHIRAVETHFEFELQQIDRDGHRSDPRLNEALDHIGRAIRKAKLLALENAEWKASKQTDMA